MGGHRGRWGKKKAKGLGLSYRFRAGEEVVEVDFGWFKRL